MICPAAHWASIAPDRPALFFGRDSWSYRKLDDEIRRWTSILRQRGVGPGHRVGLLSANRPELVAIFFACARLKAAFAPLNIRLTRREVAGLLAHLTPELVIAEKELADRAVDAEVLEKLGAISPRNEPSEREIEAETSFAILFTSGTTGPAKAAELSFANFRASAVFSGRNLGDAPRQRWLGCLPLYHVGGLAMATRCMLYGASLELQRGFREEAVVEALSSGRITHFSLVDTTLQRLLDAWSQEYFPSTINAVLVGGGPVSLERLEQARRRRLPVLATYGLTEATSQVATERLGAADGQTAGPALDGVLLRVVTDDQQLAAPGQMGEIQVSGPTVMRGYCHDPTATRNAFQGCWLRTKDFGSLDQRGRLQLIARRSDMIISGGENIYPAEIEKVLASHPRVVSAAVVGKKDDLWGQVPAAVVTVSGPVTEGELQAWCGERLAGFKAPREVLIVKDLPCDSIGKVNRVATLALFSEKPGSSNRW